VQVGVGCRGHKVDPPAAAQMPRIPSDAKAELPVAARRFLCVSLGFHPMPPRSARHTILSEIAPFEKEDDELRIIIETPKGSRNKYSTILSAIARGQPDVR
jgi:hypothetical protein